MPHNSQVMTPTDNKAKLVKIYCYVCDICKKESNYVYQRFSNNNTPEFTDQEAITIYLYSMHVEHRFKLKHIYEFASEHLRSWFPKLPSYVAFTNRINRLNEAFKGMTEDILTNYQPLDCDTGITLIDSMPIITCSGKRSAKVALEITDKGYCSTKTKHTTEDKTNKSGTYVIFTVFAFKVRSSEVKNKLAYFILLSACTIFAL